MKVVALWSGGKESCLAYLKAVLDGFEVSHLLNFINSDTGRSMSHGLDSKLFYAQSLAIGTPIVQKGVTWDTYEMGFKDAIRELKRIGVEGAVFGDVNVQAHKDWVDKICKELGIEPIEPLWGINPERILTDFVNEGFEAIVVSVKADLFDEGWLERRVGMDFVKDLCKLKEKLKFHILGEYGEYHTFVIDGPIFKRKIKIFDNKKILKNERWFLDILRYDIE